MVSIEVEFKMVKYNIVLRAIHWLMAICIIGLLVVGILMTEMKVEDGKYYFYDLHKSFGTLVLLLLPIRFLVKSLTVHPPLPEGIKPIEKTLSYLVHILLYVLMLCVPVAGYIYSSSGGYPVKLFGLELPNLIGKTPWLFEIAGYAHEYLAYTLIFVLFLHLAGALKHRFLEPKENDVIGRMI